MEVIFQNGFDEIFHVLADIESGVIFRWAVLNNETLEYQDDGSTTIDFDEPFVMKYILSFYLKIECHINIRTWH